MDASSLAEFSCRACGCSSGTVVLDLGSQPPADLFPLADDPQPDPTYPLEMWLCAACGLAQLVSDPTLPEEPLAQEPAALAEQAADAIDRVAAAGLLPPGSRVAEYASPHGGSWLSFLAGRELVPVHGQEPADVLLDCFGMMHSPDQAGAVARRAARVAPGGALFLQYHSLETIIRRGQWNALRHGHYAYYSTTALGAMLAAVGFSPRRAWHFDLYGGTVLLAAGRDGDGGPDPDGSIDWLLRSEARTGVRDQDVVRGLQHAMDDHARRLRLFLMETRERGRTILGYGAASRAVALLVHAGVDSSLLAAVVDASEGKAGRRMPGTDIPVVGPSELADQSPDRVLLFVPDLLAEVRTAYPAVEASGGRWIDAETLTPA
jgi:hypothetical protein